MRIVYCISGLFNSGGMEKVIVEKANALVEMGHEVIIVTTDQKKRKSFFILNPSVKTVDLSINYSDNNSKNFYRKTISFFLKKKRHRKRLSSFLKNIVPNITISTFGPEVSFLYKISDGSKKVLEFHFSKNARNYYMRKGLWRVADIYRNKKDERIVRYYDRFVVLTNEDKNNWGNLSNMVVIPNFISAEVLHPARLHNKRCIAIGRLTNQKGFDMLIKAWNIIRRSEPTWELHIYGAGELYDSLQSMIKECGLFDVVKINTPTKQIGDEYLKSSIYLMTSRFEGLPMVLLEAFSYGLPVVSFSCECGPKDLIEDGVNGFLIPINNIELFASKTLLLMRNESVRKQMGTAALQASDNYKKEKIMGRWINLFENIVSE